MFNDTLNLDNNQFHNSKNLVQRSCSAVLDSIKSQEARNSVEQQHLTLDLNDSLFKNSAEHLNWKFLEHVTTLDNQLRNEQQQQQQACRLLAAADSLMTYSSTIEAYNKQKTDEHQLQQQQQPQQLDVEEQSIKRKENGYAINGNICNVDFSQHLQQQQQQNEAISDKKFEFSSPTATFKRRKEKHQQRAGQESELCVKKERVPRDLAESSSDDHAEPFVKLSTEGDNSNFVDLNNRQHQHMSHVTLNTTQTLPQISKRHTNAPHRTHKASNSSSKGGGGGKQLTKYKQQTGMGATMQQCSTTSGNSSIKAASSYDDLETHLGIIGWRKKCLYTLLLLLMILIITNFMLTLWVLKVMEFTTDGMGPLKIVPGGIQLTGQALIMDVLRASTIRSRHGQPIAIESSRNFSINTRDSNGMLENHLFLGHDKLECLASGFYINDTAGRNLFSVNRNEVTIGAHALRVEGEGGAIFRESIQTPHVRAEPGRELRLESPTRQLEITAAKDINLQSRAGGIEISALADVKLSTLDGSLRLESSKIMMPNLRTAQPPVPGQAQNREHLHRVFQLCACSNGKLFLAAAHSICAGDDSTVCR